jgi:signal transduction histidine kinase
LSTEVPVSERRLPEASEEGSADGFTLRALRQRFLAPVEEEGPVDRGVMARAFALLYGAGATLVLATALLSSPTGRFLEGVVVPAIVAYGVLALLLIRSARLPLWFFRALPSFGAVLITVIAYSGGHGAFNAYALLYFWVVVSAFYFFGWRHALPSFAVVSSGYALVLWHHREADYRVLYWVMGAGTLIVTSVLVGTLRGRIDELLRALRGSDQLKTTIIRSVSHDFRTPLTAIIAAGESSGSSSLDPETRREVSSVIVSEASRLSETLGKLLDISKLEGGAAMPYRTWCSIEEVIEVALERVPGREQFEVVAESVPQSVWADAAQLERAFSNIFENASRYNGSDPVRVVLKTNDESLLVQITDSGPGLALGEQDLIFEPFFHGREEGRGHRGPGLGLSIARGFVETNGGRIWTESRAGSGTTFVIELPLGHAPTKK